MARTKAVDYSGVEVSGTVLNANWPKAGGARQLVVYMSAPYFHDIEEIAVGRANILASKRGWRMLEGVTQTETTQSGWDNQYKATRVYTLKRGK